ncbi:hypothetical protein, partial [Paraconexibacter sp.]|uniref:hypothetical protein n=1 Tax=Paraconexibacter sp. TaxID=2949640 RepID=UPI0035612CD1
MSTPDGTRSVKIGDDERGGWSSDRPRRDGKERPERGPNVEVRCRVLPPSDRQRYSPGSLVVVVGGEAPAALERFAVKRFEDQNGVLSLAKVRELIRGRVPDEALEASAAKMLLAAATKRLEADKSTVVLTETLAPEERAPFVLAAAKVRKPRHLIFIDVPKDLVAEEQREAVNELRRAVDDAKVGEEGFMTALRLGGSA